MGRSMLFGALLLGACSQNALHPSIVMDAGTPEAGTTDAATTDAATTDVGPVETNTIDVATIDAGDGGTTVDLPVDVNRDAACDGTNDFCITQVAPTPGCGKVPTETGAGTIMTMGTKAGGCADRVCGDWMYSRSYTVVMPAGYDNTKAYPLVFEAPGCGGRPTEVYPLSFNTVSNAGNTVIRVGVAPPPDAIGHATIPNQGCFDDHEGDDSVDWPFYEALWDRLAADLCFDQHRVFASGISTGARLANELGCKYAGDAVHPLRGVLSSRGGLPSEPMYEPTCTSRPMAGMWIQEIDDIDFPVAESRFAIARAMKVNGCTIGTSYDTATFDDFPVAGISPTSTCKKIRGCPDLYPLVVCFLPGLSQSSHDALANPGFSRFVRMLESPPLLTP